MGVTQKAKLQNQHMLCDFVVLGWEGRNGEGSQGNFNSKHIYFPLTLLESKLRCCKEVLIAVWIITGLPGLPFKTRTGDSFEIALIYSFKSAQFPPLLNVGQLRPGILNFFLLGDFRGSENTQLSCVSSIDSSMIWGCEFENGNELSD